MIRKKIQISGLIGFMVVLNGCALFNPYIDPPTIPINTTRGAMPLLEKAIEDTQKIQNNVRCNRIETKYYRVGLGLAAFGAAAGSAITGMYGASRDLILALGLGAAGSYTGANLFFSDTKIKLYNAADASLGCVADNAYAVSSSVNSLEEERKQIIKGYENSCNIEYLTALHNLEVFKAQDNTMTHKVRAAGRRIITNLNEELEKSEPSLDNILNAAKEIGPLGTTFITKKYDGESAFTQPANGLQTGSCAIQDQLIEFAKKVDNVINNAMEQFGAIDRCNSTVLPISPLAASQTEINIGKDEDVMIRFSGGKEPLLLEPKWNKLPATDQIQVKRMGSREIMVSGKSNVPSAQSFSFEVSDSAAIPNTLLIIVNTK
jgi:hypothetical protein